jgi:hypothetical protein
MKKSKRYKDKTRRNARTRSKRRRRIVNRRIKKKNKGENDKKKII